MKWLMRLFGFKSRDEVWRECIYAEARSRGLTATPVTNEHGELVAYRLTDSEGRTFAVAAYR